MQCESVEFVITHHSASTSGFAHAARNSDRVSNLWPAVDKVATENHLPTGVLKYPRFFVIPQFVQQLHQLVRMAVNVSDDVIHEQIVAGIGLDAYWLQLFEPEALADSRA